MSMLAKNTLFEWQVVESFKMFRKKVGPYILQLIVHRYFEFFPVIWGQTSYCTIYIISNNNLYFQLLNPCENLLSWKMLISTKITAPVQKAPWIR